MEPEYKSNIYERLLEIKFKFKVDIHSIPEPQVINQKIGECHAYIEEIEHFTIQVHRELSVIQQALNNATAAFEIKRDTLLTQEPIKSLPNIKDREAQANLLLRKDREIIKEYQNNLTDLNNLLKVITLKARNLNRANGDIKLQLRVLEVQAKMGPTSNAVTKSMMEELKKSTINEDAFKENISQMTQEITVDPSTPLDVNNFLDDETDEIIDNLIEPIPQINPESDNSQEELTEEIPENNTKKTEEIPENNTKKTEEIPEDNTKKTEEIPEDNTKKTEEIPEDNSSEIIENIEEGIEHETMDDWLDEETNEEESTEAIDLDENINFDEIIDSIPKEKGGNESTDSVISTEKKPDKDEIGIDIDDLLNDYQN